MTNTAYFNQPMRMIGEHISDRLREINGLTVQDDYFMSFCWVIS